MTDSEKAALRSTAEKRLRVHAEADQIIECRTILALLDENDFLLERVAALNEANAHLLQRAQIAEKAEARVAELENVEGRLAGAAALLENVKAERDALEDKYQYMRAYACQLEETKDALQAKIDRIRRIPWMNTVNESGYSLDVRAALKGESAE